ncbi:protein SET DOMAIN GROUP 40-like [Triticum urartu]|uniref:protein SET DOMAIN GROUP 40-like n=1 Tax=Triticum urartu TaxID=4572 RepID=UPI002044C719|nr:protein SET DOMAIN GROUP 40-like [Triticum urartu]
MEALLRWAAELGVSDSLSAPASSSCLGRSLVVADFPDAGGRGFAAARDLRRGELVLRVPRAALLTSDRVMADDPRIASCVDAHRPRLSSIQVMPYLQATVQFLCTKTCSCEIVLEFTKFWG